MKKAAVLMSLVAVLGMLASCSDTSFSVYSSNLDDISSSSVESSVVDESNESDNSVNVETSSDSSSVASLELTQDQLDAIASGFAIDISVDGQLYGSVVLNDYGVTVTYANDDPRYYVPVTLVADATTDETETYVAEARLSLSNEVETEVSSVAWSDTWTNVFSLLTLNDFSKMSNGVYSVFVNEGSAIESYAVNQLSLGAAEDALEITVTTNGTKITEIKLVTSTDTITSTVYTVGDGVNAALEPATGDSIDSIDDILDSLEGLDYMVTEQYAIWNGTIEEYVICDDYTSWIKVDGGKYVLVSDGSAYIQQTDSVQYIESEPYTYDGDKYLYWYFGANLTGFTLTDIIGSCNISSLLFGETGTSGTYALRTDVPIVSDISYYDPFMSSMTVSDLTLTVKNGNLIFEALYSSSIKIIVTYSDIGTTDVSLSLNANTEINVRDLTSYYEWIASYQTAGYDLSKSMGTADTDLWYAAYSNVPLPTYGCDGISIYYNTGDSFTGGTSSDYSACLLYNYYNSGYVYFQKYLADNGFTSSYETGADGKSYYTLTTSFNYRYYVDSDGNKVNQGASKSTAVTETHTINLVRLGTSATSSTNIDVKYLITIDLIDVGTAA